MNTSYKGINLLKTLEGFSPTAYTDQAGVATIGYGFTQGVKPGDYMSREEADIRLAQELVQYEIAVNSYCVVRPNQNQFDAMVCLCWNIGIAGFRKSSVLAAHNRGDTVAAAKAFNLWNMVKGKVNKGLVRRRSIESALYLETDGAEPMPQKVEQKPLTQSKIGLGGGLAAVTAGLASIKEALDAVAQVKIGVAGLGVWAIPLLLGTTTAAAVYVLYQRWKQRQDGVA